MQADGTPETEFEEAMPLFGAILEANHRSLQWTNDQLLASKENELRRLQDHFMKLYNSLEKVHGKTDSATARDALDRFASIYSDSAEALRGTKNSY